MMVIPWMYYLNILVIPLFFAYLTSVNWRGKWSPGWMTYGWWLFFMGMDGYVMGLTALCGMRRIYSADSWEYAALAFVIDFFLMFLLMIACRTPLRKFMPHWAEKPVEVEQPEEEEAEQKKKKKEKKAPSRGWFITWHIVFFLLYFLLLVLFFTLRWYEQTFNVSFDALLYTLAAPIKGTGDEVVITALLMILPCILLTLPAYPLFLLVLRKRENQVVRWGGTMTATLAQGRHLLRGFTVVLLIFWLVSGVVLLKLPSYIASISQMSTIYEEEYADPKTVKLEAPQEKRNLILIYLESMESTYAARGEGGVNNVNYIPKLTELAKNNVHFSNNDVLGGFASCTGTGWTMAATIATTSGVPFSFPVGQNSLGRYESIAGGLTTLGDLLEKDGYRLEALFGSDASFAGTADYYEQHGNYKVYDLDDFYEDEYVEEDFYEWWGVRDELVYKAAKDQLGQLAEGDEPFALTMFTMDTHATGGFICDICEDTYSEQLGNVLECADNQIDAFIQWCQKQPWYENTTIVVTGDHPRMDSRLIGHLEPDSRRVYNCFINAAVEPAGDTTGRVFTTLDMFPTIMSAMGYTIPGHRLGLGVDMFSGEKTLAESMGLLSLNEQLAMRSDYYMRHFY